MFSVPVEFTLQLARARNDKICRPEAFRGTSRVVDTYRKYDERLNQIYSFNKIRIFVKRGN